MMEMTSRCFFGFPCRVNLALKHARFVLAPNEGTIEVVKEGARKWVIRGANIGSVTLEKLRVEGVDGPCVRSWSGEQKIEVEGSQGINDRIVPAEGPFKTRAI